MDNTQPNFKFAGEPASLGAARNVVRGYLSANGWADKEIDVTIVVGEVLQNVVRYGFDANQCTGSFWVQMESNAAELKITVEDDAPPSDPTTWSAEHREAHEGGHGLNLMHSLTSSIEFTALAQGNRVEMVFAR